MGVNTKFAITHYQVTVIRSA